MPSPLTHAVVGAAFAQALPESLPRCRAAGFLAVLAVLPDLDLMAFAVGIPYSHVFGHRGFSHSLVVAVLAGLLSRLMLHKHMSCTRTESTRFGLMVGLAVASHGLLDTITDGGLGVGLLLPFVDERLHAPFRPVTVSPLRYDRFVSDAVRILTSEVFWIWLPTAAISALGQCVRYGTRKRPAQPMGRAG